MLRRFWDWLTDPAQRTRGVLVLLGAVLAGVLFMGIVYAWEFTTQPVFCGTWCHTMPPEYNAYQKSAHARVDCVTCHVSRGVNTAVAEKVTDMRHIILFTLQSYETPIRIKALRPARESCENCHWPEKFSGDRVNKLVRFQPDAANTELNTYLIMKTGGGVQGTGKGYGIHWHVLNEVEFVATDELAQVIPWVRAKLPDGKTVEYFDDSASVTKAQLAQMPVRRMECIDCHNRTGHRIDSPEQLVESAMDAGLIDKTLPEIRARAVEALMSPAPGRANSLTALDEYYRTRYAAVYAEKKQAIASAIALLQKMDAETSFPDLQENWTTYPNNTGHKDFPGCFRCHDGKHIAQTSDVAPERSSIRLQCNVCHSIPETVLAGRRPILASAVPATQPAYHARGDWMAKHPTQSDPSCQACHGEIKYNAKPTVDNQSFCANISCHGAGWKKYIALVESPASGQPALPAPAATPAAGRGGIPRLPVDHAGRAVESCLLCHAPGAVEPYPASHAGRAAATCLGCHTAAAAGPSTPASPGAVPALPVDHAGRTADICLVCHGQAGIQPAPASHTGRTAETCLACHKPSAAAPVSTPTRVAPAATPTIARPSTPAAAPAATVTRAVITATAVTAPAATVTTTLPATPTAAAGAPSPTAAVQATPTKAAAASVWPGPLPASHAGRTGAMCLTCHSATGVKPMPATTHAGRPAEMCVLCHNPV